MKLNFTIIVLILGFLNFKLIAEDPEYRKIDITEAWSVMEEHNLELQKLIIDQNSALRELKSIGYLIPGVNISSSLSRSAPLISSLTNKNDKDNVERDNWAFRAGVDIKLSLKPTHNIEESINSILYEIIILQKQIKIRDLYSDLEKLFFKISTGEKTIKLQERILGLTEDRFKQIEKLYSRGLRSELELLAAQIAVARDQPSLKKARIDQEKRFILLRELLGFNENIIIELDNIKDKDLSSLNIGYIGTQIESEEYRSLKLQLDLSNKTLEYTIKNLKSPSIGLSLGWSSSLNPLFDETAWRLDELSDNLGLGFSFSIPLDSYIRGSEEYESIIKQKESILKGEINLESYKRQVNSSVKSLLLDIDLSDSNIKANEFNIKLQEENFKKVRANYEIGITSLQDLDDSRQELQKALVSLESERLNKNILLLDLEKITGKK